MPLAAGARFGAHEIVTFLGAGGMGEVWRARDTRLDREVALKVLPPATLDDETARARLLREARLASKLNHPHVCTIHEVGEAEGRTFVAMELVEGRPLSDLLSRGPLPTDQVLRLGQQLADALAHAHEHGVVHRDFKSANVVIAPEGRAKVLDFGLAKRLAGEEATEATTASYGSLTAPGTLAGTLAYMAPEQLRGQAADARSDIWALGVVLYEMVSGRRPFHGQTGFALSSAILNESPPTLHQGVPDGLRGVIGRCLEKEPAQRYQRAAEVRAALEALASGATVPPERVAVRRRPRQLWLVAGLVALAVMVTAAITLDLGGVRRRLTPRLGSSTRSVRLAVLPFANLSGDPGQEYLSDGITQEMIAQLGRLHPETLSVIARTSVMRYKKAEIPIDQIGRELNVEYVLEGSAQREGSRVRVSAELIKVDDQSQLWADSLEREMAGILALQSDVARNVAGALALRLLPAEQARLAGARAVNPEAYEAYLKGSQHWIKMTKGDLDAAERDFAIALEKDPTYAPAHAGMAWVWACRGQQSWAPPAEAARKQREATLKAISLDATLAEAHYLLAAITTWLDWDFRAAGPEWKRALELDPNYPDGLAMYSHYLAIMGRPEEAMTEIDRALRLDPFNVTIHSFRAIDLLFARRFDEALAQARKAVAMEPGNFVALPAKYWALLGKGKTTEAVDAIKDYVIALGMPDVALVVDQAFKEAGFAGAAKRGAEALGVHAAQGKAGAVPTDVADFYLLAGEKLRALDWLERAYEVHDPNMPYIGLPDYDPLRSEPRFQALVRKLGLPTSAEPGMPRAVGASS
jgi:serine/threonine protein kinase/Tfp pilus assembly protein PilF